MEHLTLPIAGMHCRSCELLIDEHLRQVPGVKTVRVKYQKGQAVVGYEGQTPSSDAMEEAVRNAGYSVGTCAKAPWLSRNKHDYKNLGLAAIILTALYFIARSTGLLDISVKSDNLSLPFAIVIGLVAGVSTCMAMVGGLVMGLSSRYVETHPEATTKEKFRPHLFFNLGRILGYTLLGGLLGSLGSFLKLSNVALAILTVGVGVVMVMLGVKLTSISPRLKNASLTLPSSIAKFFGLSRNQGAREYNHKSALMTGALTFFLPCGFTQAMQLYAISTGSFSRGALALGLFALGTAPALLSIGGLTSIIKGAFARRFYVTVGLAVLLFGIFNVRNGLALTGLTPSSTNSKAAKTASVKLVDGYQVVRMTQKTNGYSPNSFSVTKGYPVKWIITSENQYTCAASIIMPTYGIRQNLTLGENTIEFTPTKTGSVQFTCSMGMYRGSFNVIDGSGTAGDGSAPIELQRSSVPSAYAATAPQPSGGSGGGSCGAGGGGCGCGGGAKPAPSTAPAPKVDTTTGVQKITAQANGSLSPNDFTVKAGKPVEWTITSIRPPSGCMRAFANQQLGIYVPQAESGDTIVKFTPSQAGDYDITCAMGMWRATIHVTS